MKNEKLHYDDPIEIADGIYWVGFMDEKAGLHCNPYLIVDNDEAVLIDSGSRSHFSTVMLKIMRTGFNPKNITRLIYQHYDPDLCGNIPHMEAMIDNADLKIISQRENNYFICYYSAKSPVLCIKEMGMFYEFSSGRRLEFVSVPYCHAPGNFITYDTKTNVLFSSDIFGAYDEDWTLYTQITENCINCAAANNQDEARTCGAKEGKCKTHEMIVFHKRIMPSTRALKYALAQIEKLDVSLIAPQHGSILDSAASKTAAIKQLKSISNVGFDYLFEGINI
ncbi:MAG: MBL fold metallo-hydrolase [Oscillospiraceae bacterium]|nr:MBL fold metallo-hydrolase [Oscillospiraceae bacterium]